MTHADLESLEQLEMDWMVMVQQKISDEEIRESEG